MKLMMTIGLALICISANAARPNTVSLNQAALQYKSMLATRTPNMASLKMRMPNAASSKLMLSARVPVSVQSTAKIKGAANIKTSMRGIKGNSKWLQYQNLLLPNQNQSNEDDSDYYGIVPHCTSCSVYY